MKELTMQEFKHIIEQEAAQQFNKNNQMLCPFPFHKEKTPSFSIYEDGKPKFKCFGCETQGDIIDFIRLYKNMNFYKACEHLKSIGINIDNADNSSINFIISHITSQIKHIPAMSDFKIEEIYKYLDHKGNPQYYKAKFKTDNGKTMRYYSIIDNEVTCKRAGPELPYNLYRLVKSNYHTVYITEGEKDADTLVRMGFLAVSLKNFKYDKFHCRFFKNKNIIIIPDNDKAGADYKNKVIEGLKPYIKAYKVFPIESYSHEVGQDITDLLELKILDKQKFMDILKEIKWINTYEWGNGNINTIKLAKMILNCEDIIYSGKEGFFHYEDGYYKLKGNEKNRVQMRALVSNYLGDIPRNTNTTKNEVLNHMMEETYIPEIELDEDYINFKNGLLKVTKEGYELVEHAPDIVTIHRFDYDFEPLSYKDSLYYTGLMYALYDDMEKVRFLQQYAGACLMPNARLMKTALIVTGGKGTGKSTFIEPLQGMMKGLYSSFGLKTIEENRFALSDLIDKKCILSTENSGRPLESCDNLKRLIQGESISSDRKNLSTVELSLNLAIIMGMNRIPKFNDPSDAIFDRLHFIKFERKIRGTKTEDPHFIEKIIKNEQEMLAVINFALDGLLDLKRNDYKLNVPKSVQGIKEEVLLANNPFNSWLVNCVEMGKTTDYVSLKELYNSYLGYCMAELSIEGVEARNECSQDEMKTRLRDKGYEFVADTKRNGERVYNIFTGIRLNERGLSHIIK